MTHNFLYFLAACIEVIAFYHMTNPLKWFIFLFFFMFAACVLYIFDFILISRHKHNFSKNEQTRALYAHIEKRQRGELLTVVPMGFLFNALGAIIIFIFPSVFVLQKYHLVLVGLQVIAMIIVLSNFLTAFHFRTRLITQVIEK